MWPFRDRTAETPSYDVENTIGAGSRVRGDLSGPGGFRVDGTVEGAITAVGPVVIGEAGVVEGSVSGRDVVVLGRVRGDVHATGHLEVGPKGKVLGDITVQSFRMHTGGVFHGTSCMPGGEEDAPVMIDVTSTLDTRVRTLPPPNGAVVPPPPALAELAEMVTATRGSDAPDEAVSQQRLITTSDESSPARRAAGS
jgi:cytoskeletal protein CcmA (bactofilin family)